MVLIGGKNEDLVETGYFDDIFMLNLGTLIVNTLLIWKSGPNVYLKGIRWFREPVMLLLWKIPVYTYLEDLTKQDFNQPNLQC